MYYCHNNVKHISLKEKDNERIGCRSSRSQSYIRGKHAEKASTFRSKLQVAMLMLSMRCNKPVRGYLFAIIF